MDRQTIEYATKVADNIDKNLSVIAAALAAIADRLETGEPVVILAHITTDKPDE